MAALYRYMVPAWSEQAGAVYIAHVLLALLAVTPVCYSSQLVTVRESGESDTMQPAESAGGMKALPPGKRKRGRSQVLLSESDGEPEEAASDSGSDFSMGNCKAPGRFSIYGLLCDCECDFAQFNDITF